jgi:hypothetical protein
MERQGEAPSGAAAADRGGKEQSLTLPLASRPYRG